MHDSVTRWISGLKEGDEQALEQIFARYYEPIVRLVQRRLPPAARRSADEEDVALSALNSFLRRAKADEFPQLESRDDLWKLLVAIARRKSIKHITRETAQKRGGGEVRGESVFVNAKDSEMGGDIGAYAAESHTPAEEVEIKDCAEQILEFLDALDDSTLKTIAVWKSYGMTDKWIAEQLGVAKKTIQRKVGRIRDKVQDWQDERGFVA